MKGGKNEPKGSSPHFSPIQNVSVGCPRYKMGTHVIDEDIWNKNPEKGGFQDMIGPQLLCPGRKLPEGRIRSNTVLPREAPLQEREETENTGNREIKESRSSPKTGESPMSKERGTSITLKKKSRAQRKKRERAKKSRESHIASGQSPKEKQEISGKYLRHFKELRDHLA